MPVHSFGRIVGWLRGLGGGQREGSDAELLRAYAVVRDESAFAELVRRHGPLVWGLCRRSLAREQDAEDAFQATFVVLARKAQSIRKADSLASWLFGVARRSASLIRERDRRPIPEAPMRHVSDPSSEAASAEACDTILDEVRRLPDRYRLPLLLCGLEGLTKAEAARRLGWKEGTVSGRLARARSRLQKRLLRRGVVGTSAAVPALGAVPAPLLAATLQASVRSAAPSPAVSLLAQEVIRSMKLPTTVKLLVALALVGLCTIAFGAAVYRPTNRATPVAENDRDPPPETGVARWQERLRLRGYSGGAYREFSPDGKVLATINGRNQLQFLDATTWQPQASCALTKYKNGTYYPDMKPFSPDGKLFVVGWRVPGATKADKPRLETWLIEAATGKVRKVLPGNLPRFSPDGKLLAVNRGESLTLYDITSGAEVRTLAAGSKIKWQGNWFSPDSKLLCAATERGRAPLWEVASGKQWATLEGFLPVWSKDSKSLATTLPGPVVKLWDAATGKERATLKGFDFPGCGVEFSPDGRLVLTTTSEYGLKPDGEYQFPKFPQPYTPKRLRLDLRLWDAATGKELLRLPGEVQHCRGGTFSPDGKTILYQRLTDDPGYKMEAVLWDVAAGKEQRVFRPPHGLDGVSFTPDGTAVGASVNGPTHEQTTLTYWDARTGKVLAELPGTGRMFVDLRFSPDGRILTMGTGVPLPPGELPPGGVPSPMEVRVYLWRKDRVASETRGEPIPIKLNQPKKTESAAGRAWEALKKEHEAGDTDFAARYAAAKSDAEKWTLEKARLTALTELAARALALAREHPKDPAALAALEWALRCTGGSASGKLGEMGVEAVALVRQTLLTSPLLDRMLPWLAHHQSAEAEKLLETALKESPHREVRARAGHWLAMTLAEEVEAVRTIRQMPELADHPRVKERAAYIKRLQSLDADEAARRAEQICQRLIKDYADVKLSEVQSDRLGEVATRALFALRHLTLGKPAPEIEGKDLDGKTLKLSDFRGRVVVLIFCGHWCGPCRVMNPHKQTLVKRHAGKPFALLEVNSDSDPEEWKRMMKKEGYTWRCWADGGREGPIARRWNVTHWPTIYVLDGKGLIRYKELRDEPLEKAVETLLAEEKGR
jgi:RNA polymerase sigma factor (sigma-70 family)